MYFNLFNESITTGFKTESIFFLSLIAILFGVSIIITKNPVVSVLYLIGLFVTVSVYLMILGLYFIGLSYLLVYVGAVSILFLFILMLISVRTSELVTEGKNSIPLAIISVICFNYSVNTVLPDSIYKFDVFNSYLVYIKNYINHYLFTGINYDTIVSAYDNKLHIEIANVTSKSWDTNMIENNHISSIGNILYGELYIYLMIVGLILLLSLVGTVLITLKK